MITDENIKEIPKYMLKRIEKLDKEYNPKPDGHTRFYTYFTKYNNELCSVTVAVRNKYKKWYCKQVVVHGIHSDKVWLRDIVQTMGFLKVGWYREGLTKEPSWHDYDWGYNDDKYFQMTTATIVNKEYITTLPEYKYSAIEQYQRHDILKYLRLYEQYPQSELLVKAGLSELATSKLVLRQCAKDKAFCKYLYQNKEELQKQYCYANTVLTAYKKNKPLRETQILLRLKKEFANKDNFRTIRQLLPDKIEKVINYLSKQNVDGYSYSDYLNACRYLNIDLTQDKNAFPHDFQRWHDIRIDEMHSKQAEEDRKIRKELYSNFKKVSDKYNILQRQLKDSYITLIAKSPTELVKEGDFLHHCVGRMGYDQKFARGESLIFFIRTKEQPEIPLVTLEYSPTKHKILQCYADHDSTPSDEILNYVNKIWLPYANRKIRQIAI